MSSQPDDLSSVLADEAIVAAMVPWACPCEFGPGGRYLLEELVGPIDDEHDIPPPEDPVISLGGPRYEVDAALDLEADTVEHAQGPELLDDVLDADDGLDCLFRNGRHAPSFPACGRPPRAGSTGRNRWRRRP